MRHGLHFRGRRSTLARESRWFASHAARAPVACCVLPAGHWSQAGRAPSRAGRCVDRAPRERCLVSGRALFARRSGARSPAEGNCDLMQITLSGLRHARRLGKLLASEYAKGRRGCSRVGHGLTTVIRWRCSREWEGAEGVHANSCRVSTSVCQQSCATLHGRALGRQSGHALIVAGGWPRAGGFEIGLARALLMRSLTRNAQYRLPLQHPADASAVTGNTSGPGRPERGLPGALRVSGDLLDPYGR